MLRSLFISFLFFTIVLSQETTHDPEFEKKFQVTHLKEGDGKTFAKKGDSVHVHYEGTLLNGKKFDSSYDRKKPLQFTLGIGQVIKCWDLSVARLSLGEKIKVVCPYDLAYGERGAGSVIPPKSDLVFVMELMKIGDNSDL